jgi:hypothetical protein
MSEALIKKATRWVEENYPYNPLHLLQSLVWLDRLAPNSREAVRLATLTHDMERAVPGPDQPAIKLNDVAYYKAHSERSARIVGSWLREQGADEAVVKDVEALVLVHEFGGWPEANLVQAADSLSFLEVNIDLFLGFARSGRFTVPDIRGKFHESYDRIQVAAARPPAKPMLDNALARLDEVEAEMSRTAVGQAT